MKHDKSSRLFLLLVLAVLLVLTLSCARQPKIVGKWREIGKAATLEFLEDGSFKAVDDMGMAVSGKYTLFENGRVRFEILHPGSSSETIEGKVSVQTDELVISFEKAKDVEKYRRLK